MFEKSKKFLNMLSEGDGLEGISIGQDFSGGDEPEDISIGQDVKDLLSLIDTLVYLGVTPFVGGKFIKSLVGKESTDYGSSIDINVDYRDTRLIPSTIVDELDLRGFEYIKSQRKKSRWYLIFRKNDLDFNILAWNKHSGYMCRNSAKKVIKLSPYLFNQSFIQVGHLSIPTFSDLEEYISKVVDPGRDMINYSDDDSDKSVVNGETRVIYIDEYIPDGIEGDGSGKSIPEFNFSMDECISCEEYELEEEYYD